MEELRMCKIRTFENWQYCEPDVQAGLNRANFFSEEDLFKVPVFIPVNPAYLTAKGDHYRRKVRRRNGVGVEMQKKQEKAYDSAVSSRRYRTPKAVDEDLYKVPQELLCQKPKRKMLVRNLLSGCLRLNCIS